MNHSSNESLSKLEFKNDFISDFAKNKLVEVVRVTNDLQIVLMTLFMHDKNCVPSEPNNKYLRYKPWGFKAFSFTFPLLPKSQKSFCVAKK